MSKSKPSPPAAPAPGGLHSMTGYAQARRQAAGLAATVTLKAVNHRYLDLRWQAPEEADGLRAGCEQQIRAQVRRGHVEVRISLERAAAAEWKLDTAVVDAYLLSHQEILSRLGDGGRAPDPHEILRFPGVLTQAAGVREAGAAGEAGEPLAEALAAALGEALERLNRMRRAEGEAMARELRARLDEIERGGREIAGLRPEVEAALLARIRTRLAELGGAGAPPERVLQEAALQAERSDISEELTRLQAHLDHFRTLMREGGEAGKRLDFLSQELNREVNTLLAKTNGGGAAALRISRRGLDLKADVEKIRELVQNLE